MQRNDDKEWTRTSRQSRTGFKPNGAYDAAAAALSPLFSFFLAYSASRSPW